MSVHALTSNQVLERNQSMRRQDVFSIRMEGVSLISSLIFPTCRTLPLLYRVVVFFFLSSALLIDKTHGFANNLVDSTLGCMTELDPSEVIMNGSVKPAESSKFPDIHLGVVTGEDHQYLHNESPFQYQPDPGTSTVTLTIVFMNTYSLDEFPEKNDLQFVIQLVDMSGGTPGISASFANGGTIGCEGNQRISARYKDNGGEVQLQIHDPTVSFKLWAGWATGQQAVQLTPVLMLEPKPEEGEEPVVEEAKKGDELPGDEKVTTEGNEEGKDAEKYEDVEVTDQHQVPDTPSEKDQTGQKQQDGHAVDIDSNNAGNEVDTAKKGETQKKKKDTRRIMEKRKQMHDEIKKRQQVDEGGGGQQTKPKKKKNFSPSLSSEENNNKRSFQHRYEKGVELDTTSHLAASIFFLLSVGSILFIFRKQRSKGHLL